MCPISEFMIIYFGNLWIRFKVLELNFEWDHHILNPLISERGVCSLSSIRMVSIGRLDAIEQVASFEIGI